MNSFLHFPRSNKRLHNTMVIKDKDLPLPTDGKRNALIFLDGFICLQFLLPNSGLTVLLRPESIGKSFPFQHVCLPCLLYPANTRNMLSNSSGGEKRNQNFLFFCTRNYYQSSVNKNRVS